MRVRDGHDGMSEDERVAFVESVFIEYPRLKKFVEAIDHCRRHSKIAAEPECIFIGGCSGAGKTTLLLHYVRQLAGTLVDGRRSMPALLARVPARANEKTLVTALLRCIRDPAAEKGAADRQTARLIRRMEDSMVEICLIDEFQHFVDKDSARVLKNVSDWLKNLIGESGRPFVLCGMPYAEHILDIPDNEQLRRRVAARLILEPFGWHNKDQRTEFRSMLMMLDRRLRIALGENSGLADVSMAYRLYCATNGRVGYVMRIIRRAAELAITRGKNALNLDLLAEAYNERMMSDFKEHPNPFLTDLSGLRITPFTEHVPDFRLTNRRSKAKGKKESAASVLHK
jgi:hypothetical protein